MNKILYFFKCTLIVMFIALLAFQLPVVYASEAGGEVNIGGEGTGSASLNGIVGGWSEVRQGFRLYIVNESNTSKSPVLDIWFCSPDEFFTGNQFKYGRTTRGGTRLASLWERVTASNLLEGDMPKPWIGEATNYQAVENWLLEVKEGYDINNAERAIEQVFGEGVLDEFRENAGEDPYYLFIEGLANFGVYKPYEETKNPNGGWNNYTGKAFAGTFYNWCDWCYSGCGSGDYWETGGVPLKSRTNTIFATGIQVVEREGWSMDRFDKLAVPEQTGGTISTEMGLQYGYDVAIYRISDITMNGLIRTYDTVLGDSKGPAEQPKTKGQEGIFSIVKIYALEKNDGSREYEGCYTRLKVCKNIEIMDEPLYNVRAWHTSSMVILRPYPSNTTWEQVNKCWKPQSGSSPGTVSLDYDTGERTLFVLLVREEEETVEQDLILRESEISRYFKLSDVAEFSGLDRRITWTSPSLGLSVCGFGPLHDNHDGIVNNEVVHRPCNHYCGNTEVILGDNTLNLKVRNEYESSYSHILAVAGEFSPKVHPENGVQYTRTYTGEVKLTKAWDYTFTVWRGQDELTLADYSFSDSSGVSWETSPIDSLIGRLANIPQSERWTNRETDVPLTILLKEDSSGDYVTSGRFSCGHRESVESIATPDREVNATGNVKVYSYSGQPSGSVSTSSPKNLSSMSGVTRGNGIGIAGDTVLSFYPYIRMTYEVNSSEKHDVNVLSQHKRSLTVNEYFEAGYKKASDINLNITSQQWSVHQLSTNPSAGNSWAGRNKVLPGGALYSVDSDGLSGASIVLRTWQFISEGENRQRLVEAGTSFGSDPHTIASAQQAHQEFVESAIESFNNGYYIEQSVNKNPETTNVFGGDYTTVQRGGYGLNGSLSDEDKYYMTSSADSVGDIQSALVQAGEASLSTIFYRIYSDTSGNVYLAKAKSYDGVIGTAGSRILAKDQSASSLSGVAKELDSRMGVISNFVSTIERNTGDDETASWAPDAKWYNEAFELVIMVQTSQFGVGLQNPARRETVLDPALCPSNSGRADLFSSAYSSAYRLSSYSIKYPDKGSGYAGSFKGQDIHISGIQDMYKSKVFVIPNVNVQDLD